MTIDNLGINQLLQAHNEYRSDVGVSPLTWSQTLANSAQNWSNHLANVGRLEHSGSEFGENIWMGTSEFYSFPEMVDSWGEEKEYFIPGSLFPNVSTTSNWSDVGHYTQIVWEDTTELGCGLSTGGGNDYLTCQYDPAGNIFGQRVYDPNVGDAGDETISVGVAPNYPPYSDSNYLNEDLTERVYTFEIDETSSINLNLHDITTSNDADLYLYRDDGDGVFDLIQDQELASSRRAGNADDSINYLAEPASYFARVERYAPGSQGSLDYELDLSATLDTPSSTEAPNLLPREIDLGDIALNSLGNQTITRSGGVGGSDTADTYQFSASGGNDGVEIDVSLTGLSSDADIRLIQDRNRDQIVDLDEIIESSTLGSTSNESFSTYLDNSELANYDYFVQVYQYSGDTSYDLNMTFQSTIG